MAVDKLENNQNSSFIRYFLYASPSLLLVLLFILLFSKKATIAYKNPLILNSKIEYITVFLGEGFKNSGFYEIEKNTTLSKIFSIYESTYDPELHKNINVDHVLKDGETVSLSSSNSNSSFSKTLDNQTKSINSASIEDLQKVNGIGPKTAEKIYHYIQENKIDNINDLLNINGIGEKTLEDIKKHFH